MKSYFAILTFLLAGFPVCAQVKWLETEYNFGTIREADGPVTGSARFVNTSDSATFIAHVRPSCGCTGASYPHTMIEPGDTAAISFTYNPKGRPGSFDKNVKVYVGAGKQLATIRIQGIVIGDHSTLDADFPVSAGPLRVESDIVPFGELKQGMRRHVFLNAYNQGREPIMPVIVIKGKDKAVSADVAPREVKPGDVAVFSFYIDSAKSKPGSRVWQVELKPSKDSVQSIPITLRANITADSNVFIK